MMALQDILFSQGFGTRRVCFGLVQMGHVAVGEPGAVCTDPLQRFDTEGLRFWVQGQAWAFHERAYLMLHKPAGYECSHKPGAHPGVYTLLPGPLRERGGGASAGVQADASRARVARAVGRIRRMVYSVPFGVARPMPGLCVMASPVRRGAAPLRWP